MAEDLFTTSDTYVLSRNEKSTSRLSAQHILFKEKSGWLLHPAVAAYVKDKKGIEVADIATGNGIWSLQLAEERPDTNNVALDISRDQYPPAWTYQNSNVKFGIWNIFDPVPKEYLRRFDVVHLRLVVGATFNKDKTIVIDHLMDMLKPGGYLQWQEAVSNIWHQVDDSFNIMPHLSKYQRAIDKSSTIFANSLTYDNLTDDLRKRGLVNVEKFDMPIKPYLLGYETYCVTWGLNELEEVIKSRDLDPAYVEELASGREEFSRDIASGQRWCYQVPVFVGRKSE